MSEIERLELKSNVLCQIYSNSKSIRYNIDAEKESIQSLKQERSELEAELAELPDEPMGEYADLDDRIQRLRNQKQRLENEIQDLQSVIQFNETRLEDGAGGPLDGLGTGQTDGGAVTDQLLPDEEDEVVCWTCGSAVQASAIEETLDQLRSLRSDKLGETSDIEAELDELLSERRSAKQTQREIDRKESRLEDVEDEIEQRNEETEHLQERKAELTDEVEPLEDEVDALESDDFSEILDLYKEANQIEFEIERLERGVRCLRAKFVYEVRFGQVAGEVFP